MAMSDKILTAFNEQINKELYSSYLYLSMAAYLNSINLKGFENWMKVQAQEEMFHAMKFYDFIGQKGGRVKLAEIATPPENWKSLLDVFESTLNHEQLVTASIHNLVSITREEKDYACETFLTWFVTEQVEEEDSANEMVEKIKMIKDSSEALFVTDKEMGQRVFNMPA